MTGKEGSQARIINQRYQIADDSFYYGHTAEVYRGTDIRTGEPVIVKLAKEKQSPALRREIDIHSTLNHPHVLPLKDSGVDQEFPYLVTNLLPKGSIKDNARRLDYRFDPPEAAAIILQTGEGLLSIHREGVVHGDIKPSNIFIADEKTYQLGDFSNSRLEEDTQNTGMLHTVYTYGAQEVTTSGQTRATDVYALASVSYRILTGRRVYDSFIIQTQPTAQKPTKPDTFETVLRQYMTTEHEFFEPAVRSGLTINPQERPSLEEYLNSLKEANQRMQEYRSGVIVDLKSPPKGTK